MATTVAVAEFSDSTKELPLSPEEEPKRQLAELVSDVQAVMPRLGIPWVPPLQLTPAEMESGKEPPSDCSLCWSLFLNALHWKTSRALLLATGILLACGFPFVLIGFALSNAGWTSIQEGVLGVYCVSLYTVFLLGLCVCAFMLLNTANEASISGMVAQRYNKVCYAVILMLTGACFFTSCFVVCNGLALGANPSRPYVFILASLSPLISGLILVFPLPVTLSVSELSMIPLDVPYSLPAQREPQFLLLFYRAQSPRVHRVLHYTAVMTGVAAGYTIVVDSLTHYYSHVDARWGIELALLLVSAVALLLFFLNGIFENCLSLSNFRTFSIYCEFLGLFYYLVVTTFAAGFSGNLFHLA